jgi:hypothetical protein
MIKAYIGVDGITYRKLVEPAEITITRAEGAHWECDRVQTAKDWIRANSTLMDNSRTAPKGGGYHKHDFKVVFEDGFEYSGRYDLQHLSHGWPRLQDHVRGSLEFMANDPRAEGMIPAERRELARNLLKTHDVGQPPVMVQDGEKVEIIRDYRVKEA